MVQTKHLVFLVFVAFLFGGYSFYNLGLYNSPATVNRSISSDPETQIVEVPIYEDIELAERQVQNAAPINDLGNQQLIQQFKINSSQSANSHTEVDYSKLCSLPRQFIKDDIYNTYCRNQGCLRAGASCTRDGSCCSQMCIRGTCAAAGDNLLLPGETCKNDNECYSNNCDTHPFTINIKICYGDNKTPYCSRVGNVCKENGHCCSNVCRNKQCVGSKLDPAPIGYPCVRDNSECETGYCNLRRRQCE